MKISIKLLAFISFGLSGCSTMMNPSGSIQPVVDVNAGEQIYFTSCSGSVEDWGSCYKKASQKCVNGYTQIKKVESPVGGKREITFQCNR